MNSERRIKSPDTRQTAPPTDTRLLVGKKGQMNIPKNDIANAVDAAKQLNQASRLLRRAASLGEGQSKASFNELVCRARLTMNVVEMRISAMLSVPNVPAKVNLNKRSRLARRRI